MEFYAAMKKNKMLSFAGKWMELENIILITVLVYIGFDAIHSPRHHCGSWNVFYSDKAGLLCMRKAFLAGRREIVASAINTTYCPHRSCRFHPKPGWSTVKESGIPIML
jgi:hypothetical protein